MFRLINNLLVNNGQIKIYSRDTNKINNDNVNDFLEVCCYSNIQQVNTIIENTSSSKTFNKENIK